MSAPRLASELEQRLLAAARGARERAYAPYSRFRVGAAVLTHEGSVYRGCNVENASYGLTICAERSAIFAAVAAEGPGMKLRAVAVCTDQEVPCSPCGACRQVIAEFGADSVVLFYGQSGLQQLPIQELLPETFRL